MKVRKEEPKLKKDLSEIEVGDMLCVDEKEFLFVMDARSLEDLNFNYCAVQLSVNKLEFWFQSETLEEFREVVSAYPIDTERFSKDEYTLDLRLNVDIGNIIFK